MIHTLPPQATQLIQAIGWGLLHSLWQGALIWLLLIAIFRAFPAMSVRLKHHCAIIALMLLSLWIVNTAVSQWQEMQVIVVHVMPGSTVATTGYVVEVPAARQSLLTGSSFAHIHTWIPWMMLVYGIGLLAM